jgi:NADH-quinone oxidoreductase subunit C
MSKQVLERLHAQFGSAILETCSQFGDDTAIVAAVEWRAVALYLRDDPRLAMDMFTDLCGVDRLAFGEPRFEVVCHLRSLTYAHRIRIKARVGNADGSQAEIDSLVPVWRGANWFERETFDMFGIVFRGHPDLRRILMYPEFLGHPLRKDYPADRTQPLVPYREGTVGKLPPFGPHEGMSFGRNSFELDPQEGRKSSPRGDA